MVPGNLVRLRTFDSKGHEVKETEAVSVFREGSCVAYDTLIEDAYWQEAVLPSIDLQRDVKRARFKTVGHFAAMTSAINSLYPIMGLLIVGVVLIWTFLSGGA